MKRIGDVGWKLQAVNASLVNNSRARVGGGEVTTRLTASEEVKEWRSGEEGQADEAKGLKDRVTKQKSSVESKTRVMSERGAVETVGSRGYGFGRFPV